MTVITDQAHCPGGTERIQATATEFPLDPAATKRDHECSLYCLCQPPRVCVLCQPRRPTDCGDEASKRGVSTGWLARIAATKSMVSPCVSNPAQCLKSSRQDDQCSHRSKQWLKAILTGREQKMHISLWLCSGDDCCALAVVLQRASGTSLVYRLAHPKANWLGALRSTCCWAHAEICHT